MTDPYFSALASPFERARRFILTSSWQLDSRFVLCPKDASCLAFGDFLHDLVRRNRKLNIYLLILGFRDDSCRRPGDRFLGDINEWRPQGFAIRMFNARLGRGISARSFPSFYPVFALDRLWISPRAALIEKTITHHGLERVR